jgi:uncharacterized membrane protein
MTPQGFVAFIAITCGMFLFPIFPLLGSPTLWVLLPFILSAVALVWYFLQRSNRDAELRETLTLREDSLELTRRTPRKPEQNWQANPYWVRIQIHATGGPVANYITLSGSDREVELGAFLSPEERIELYRDLSDRLRRLDYNAH